MSITTLRFLSFLSALPCRQKKSGASERDILPAFTPVQVTDRLYLGCCLFWLPLEFLISHLYDEAVDGDKHFSFFLLQDSSDVTLCLHQQHDLFLYFAHDLMDFFVLPKILPSSWREKKMSFFKFLFMQLLCDHNLLHRLHLVLSLDMKRERKGKNKQEIRKKTSLITMSFSYTPVWGFFPHREWLVDLFILNVW